jgi:BirA family transcriptional regulator, biotin operon repressor / biotin---[acetyl-CoA-carboxylase] ligase
LFAERQSAGRGRRGRCWTSPLAANLYFSVSRRFHTPMARMGGLSLAVGVALAEAVASLGVAGARVKWPNDVWVAGRKLAGVLIETGGELGGPVDAVIGVGLNVMMPAEQGAGIGQAWTDLAREGGVSDRNRVAAVALGALLPALEQFDREGLGAFLERFSRLDALEGEAVEVVLSQGRVQGRALGVTADGALRMALDAGGERCFHAGEASLRRTGGE